MKFVSPKLESTEKTGPVVDSKLEAFKVDANTLVASRSYPEPFDVMYKRVAGKAGRCFRGIEYLYAGQDYGVVYSINSFDLSNNYVYWVKIEK